MSGLIAYMGSDPERLRAALLSHRELLRVPMPDSMAADVVASCGVGFYQGGEVLLQRRPRLSPTSDAGGVSVDLYDMIKDLRTDTLLGQVRPQVAARLAKNENTPPFRFRSWLLAHQGQIAGMEKQSEAFLQVVPDFLRRNLRGQTDTEVVFHLFLAALHEAGTANLEDANLAPEAALRALLKALVQLAATAKRLGGELGPQQVVLTNGRLLVALRRGAGPDPLGVLRLGAVTDGGRSHEHFRGVLVCAAAAQPVLPEPAQEESRQARSEEIAADHALLIGRDLVARVVPAGPSA